MSNLNAIELSTLCSKSLGDCKITEQQSEITNNSPFSSTGQISIQTQITDFINYSTIKAQKIEVKHTDNHIANFYNYGRIETTDKEGSLLTDTIKTRGFHNIYNYGHISSYVFFAQSEKQNTHIVNYGTIGGIAQNIQHNKPITIANYGEINLFQLNGSGKKYHFSNVNITLQNYAMKINERADKFNSFDGNAEDNSHLILGSYTSVKFADKNSKLILDFGDSFEFGAGYKLDKLIVKADDGTNALSVDFDRLMPKSDIYTLYKQGDYFIARLQPQHSAISNIYKANIRTMNNFYTMSNSMIYPRKSYNSQNLGRTHSLLQHSPSLSTSGARGWVEYPSLQDSANLRISSLRDLPTANRGNPFIKESLDSAFSLKSYESFSYRNESVNRRIQRQNKRNYNRQSRTSSQNQTQNLKETQRNSQNLNADSANQTNKTNQNNLRDSANRDYYFILTPFVNHNYFFESGRYNLSGFDYGFLTAFSTQVAESNSLGAHFIFSYGSLGDSKDKDLSIKNLNLNIGINYKLDLIWDMYLKARGDFFYFLNQVKTLTMFEAIKPNNLGFGASVAYGKDFNFGKGGVLGIEAGLDYKALKTNEVSLQNNADKSVSETYQKSLYNLIYADLGMSYNKYFGGFGINLGTGFKANLAPKLAESILILNSQTLKFTLDNDKYLAYANAGISYVLNAKNFDMEFSLAYYGNYGDRVISNGGGVEFRVVF